MMKPETYITTSWDDGHPLDIRVAELLNKYGLSGTFYVPMTAENETMTAAQLRELSLAFEIGSHTLHHNVLTGAADQQAWREIVDSKSWVEEETGLPCLMFCAPKGKYWRRHLAMIEAAGYLGLRTVELNSLDAPRQEAGLLVMPTTIQAYPHGTLDLAKNALKRAALGNLWRFVVHGRSGEWPVLAQSLLLHAVSFGGVFHLWGHSWELQDTDQWQRLEGVLGFLSRFVAQAPPLTNGQISQRYLARDALLETAARQQKRSEATP
jgi:peptidoglycan-N-acetylglucosamine deacetylase